MRDIFNPLDPRPREHAQVVARLDRIAEALEKLGTETRESRLLLLDIRGEARLLVNRTTDVGDAVWACCGPAPGAEEP